MNMKVLLIHNYYRHFGGEDAAADNDCRLLEENGITVRRYSRDSKETTDYSLLDKAMFPLRTIHSTDTVREINQVVLDFSPDVAYVHNIYPLISPSIYKALHDLNVPIVQVLHDFRPFCANGWNYVNGQTCEKCTGGLHWNAIRNKCMHNSVLVSTVYAMTLWNLQRTGALRYVSAFICPSEYSRNKAIRNGLNPDQLFIRSHFVDVNNISSGKGARGYFLFLGRLSREKGIWTLLQAAQQLGDAEFVLAGAGPMENEIRTWIAAHGIRNVSLPGFHSNAAKWAVIRDALAVVVPSESDETFGITVIEAYAAGRPVIASGSGSLPYLVDNGKTGLVFASKNVAELHRCLKTILNDPPLAEEMGIAGRRLAERKFTPEASYRVLRDIFDLSIQAGRGQYSSADCIGRLL